MNRTVGLTTVSLALACTLTGCGLGSVEETVSPEKSTSSPSEPVAELKVEEPVAELKVEESVEEDMAARVDSEMPAAPARKQGKSAVKLRSRARTTSVHALARGGLGMRGKGAGGAGFGRLTGVGNIRSATAEPNTEAYDSVEANDWKRVADAPLSTFSIDVDTASYANVRRMLREGRLPVHGAVRIEEMLNYFNYGDQPPTSDDPFAVHTEIGMAPWNDAHQLVRIGLKGKLIPRGDRPPSNLVFLLDVSGSMSSHDKLPLLKKAFKVLVAQLDERDTVTIAVYAGASGLALPPTRGDRKAEIVNALQNLRAGGGTHGAAGIRLAYEMAQKHFVKGGINRVILATDGDMNVGTTSRSELVKLVQNRASNGVFLSVLGFGRGNLKDATMEAIADKGNGNYAYIDSVAEARKVLSDQFGGTLITIAKDVKLQLEFNPAHVAGYRLIGYENRVLAARDFNDDKKDAGELGAGHTVTALYEVVPTGLAVPGTSVDALKYQKPAARSDAAKSGELLTVKLRYKTPMGTKSRLLTHPVLTGDDRERPSLAFQWASAVAGFGMLLRNSTHKGAATWDSIIGLATSAVGSDPTGQRMEMVVLAKEARRLAMASRSQQP